MLAKELCQIKRSHGEIAATLKMIMPVVLIKTVYEKNFIVIEAKQAC